MNSMAMTNCKGLKQGWTQMGEAENEVKARSWNESFTEVIMNFVLHRE